MSVYNILVGYGSNKPRDLMCAKQIVEIEIFLSKRGGLL